MPCRPANAPWQGRSIFYEQLLEALGEHRFPLQGCAAAVAELDALNNLAERAMVLNLSCPELIDEPLLEIREGRHPVVEQVMEQPFVANDVNMDRKRQMLIITGPNMGGKSTYMRQIALIVLLAHIGAFVPARSARIGPFDRIFTRIGASDDLTTGRSTFMVEMTETANILNNATEHSLVLMDEIGRGTSTFDGLSLAWACAQELVKQLQAFTLFATHYFEMTRLAELLPTVFNVHLDAVEYGDSIVFLHALREGPASQSYGLQVAALAGVPESVLQQAKRKLHELEESSEAQTMRDQPTGQRPLFEAPPAPLSPPAIDPLCDALAASEPDELSPRQALELLYRLKRLAAAKGSQ